MAHRSRTQEEHKARAHQMLASAGNPMKHEDAKQDRALIKQELKQHVKPAALTKLARGGAAKKGVTINIIHGDEQRAAQQGLQKGMQVGQAMGARAAMQHPMPAPAMAPGAPPGGVAPRPPMGAAGAPPMGGGMKKGGTVKVREHTRRARAKSGPFEHGGKKPFDE